VSVDWQPYAGFLNHWQAELPGQLSDTVVRYRIAGWYADTANEAPPDIFAKDGQGFWSHLTDDSPVTTFAYYVDPETALGPAWMDKAIIYHIFLDRYHPGNSNGRFVNDSGPTERHGGTIRGVTQTLPHLANLGINCIWLSPINISDTYHHYDATDLYTIDPELGTNDDLRELIKQAHAQNIRVILDFVPSHISWKHPAFQAAKADPYAETASWFVFTEWPDKYRCFLNLIPFLVSIDTNDQAARSHLIENALYWINEFGMDGFRLDHAIGHGMDFWVAMAITVVARRAWRRMASWAWQTSLITPGNGPSSRIEPTST
jgi:1,4-alpha-glucan branching enzyme